jgi:hypothetical protein
MTIYQLKPQCSPQVIPWKRRSSERFFLQEACKKIQDALPYLNSQQSVKLILAFNTLARKRRQTELIFNDKETFNQLFQAISIKQLGPLFFEEPDLLHLLLSAYVKMRPHHPDIVRALCDFAVGKGTHVQPEMGNTNSSNGGNAEMSQSSAQADHDGADTERLAWLSKGETNSMGIPSASLTSDSVADLNQPQDLFEVLSETAIVGISSSLATLKIRHFDFCNRVAERVCLRYDYFSEDDIGRLVRSFGQLRIIPSVVNTSLELSNTNGGIGSSRTSGCNNSSPNQLQTVNFFEVLREKLPYRIHEFHHWNLVDIAEGYANLGITPTRNGELAGDIPDRIGTELYKHVLGMKGRTIGIVTMM